MHEERMKQGKVIVRTKLVLGYWDLIHMESGAEFSAPQDTVTIRVSEERRTAKKQRNNWWTEANWPRINEALANSRYPYFRGRCDEDCLELGFNPVTKQTVFNVLRSIERKPITYDNVFPVKKRSFLSEIQLYYVEDIIIKRDTEKIGMPSKEVVQVISELGQ